MVTNGVWKSLVLHLKNFTESSFIEIST